MGDMYGYCTIKIGGNWNIYGRELELKCVNGDIKWKGQIIGRVDKSYCVFDTPSGKCIGRIAPDYYDMTLFNDQQCSFMEVGRARGSDTRGFIEDARHNEIATYNGDRLGAAAAVICAMRVGFLGATYENFYRR